MKPRVLSSLLLVCIAVSLACAQSTPEKSKFGQPVRKFRFTYSFTVKDIPPGTKVVRVWAPVAHTDEHQTVRLVNVKAPVRTEMTQEAEYGNRIMYAEVRNPVQSTAEFTLEYEVTRREHSLGDFARLERKDTKPGVVPASMTRFIEPDRLYPYRWQDQDPGPRGDGEPGWDRRQSQSGLRLPVHDHALRQDRNRLGPRRCAVGLRCQARQLHRFPFAVHRDAARRRYSCEVRHRISCA